MEYQAKYITPDIKLSSYDDKHFKSEILFLDHMLVWFIAGETRIIQSAEAATFRTGDIFLIPRHLLATVINYPKDGKPHQSVVMHLSIARLREFYADLHVKPQPPKELSILRYNDHPLLKSCLASLIPYFGMTDPFPESIADLKIREAISILRLLDPSIDGVLANFDEPGKIDLSAFMEKNYMFNMPMARFAYLTGRSLSTFNRDFSKHYETTPRRWLTKKRLDLAWHQLREQGKKPSDVYLEVGFEDLSHFSFAFKKQFGYAPAHAAK